MKKLIATLTTLALLFLFALPAAATLHAELIALTNAQRAEHGLSAVQSNNAALNAAAQLRATEAAQLWSHTRPDGTNWSTVLAQFDIIGYSAASENLAFTSVNNPQNAINIWLNSPTHRANMLDASHDLVGIGVYYCATSNRYFWAQLFLNNGGFLRTLMRFFTAAWQFFLRILIFPLSWFS